MSAAAVNSILSPGASVVLSADSWIPGFARSTTAPVVESGGTAGSAGEVLGEPGSEIELHAPGAVRLGFAGSAGHRVMPSGNEAMPGSGWAGTSSTQLAPEPEPGHWRAPLGTATRAGACSTSVDPTGVQLVAAAAALPQLVGGPSVVRLLALTWAVAVMSGCQPPPLTTVIEIAMMAAAMVPIARTFRASASNDEENSCKVPLPPGASVHMARNDSWVTSFGPMTRPQATGALATAQPPRG
ncbi:MAG: hypothetical protein ACREOM_05185 [Candidatus Dormibacteraceae bacterium]